MLFYTKSHQYIFIPCLSCLIWRLTWVNAALDMTSCSRSALNCECEAISRSSPVLQVPVWTAACRATLRCTSLLVCPAPSWCLCCWTTGPAAPSGTPRANCRRTWQRPTARSRGCWDKQEVLQPDSPSSLTAGISLAFCINPSISPSVSPPRRLPRGLPSDPAVPAAHQERCGQEEAGWHSGAPPALRGQTVSPLPLRALRDRLPVRSAGAFHLGASRGSTCTIVVRRLHDGSWLWWKLMYNCPLWQSTVNNLILRTNLDHTKIFFYH